MEVKLITIDQELNTCNLNSKGHSFQFTHCTQHSALVSFFNTHMHKLRVHTHTHKLHTHTLLMFENTIHRKTLWKTYNPQPSQNLQKLYVICVCVYMQAAQ